MIDKLTRKNIFNIKPYLVGKPTEELANELGITKEIIRLNSNENPLGPSPKALEAMKEGLPKVNYYPDDNCYYLTQALTKKLGVDENELIISNGSAEILDFIAKCFVDPGDEVIMADQSFVIYPIVITIANGKIVSVPMKDFRHDLDAMAEAVTAKTKVIFIANPNNPTGTMNTAKEVERFIKYFQTSGRGFFTNWLIRSGKYLPMVKQILREKGLPEDLRPRERCGARLFEEERGPTIPPRIVERPQQAHQKSTCRYRCYLRL